jgi:hypothetical protein
MVTPTEAEQPVSTEDWRVALWTADDEGNRYVDVGQPMWLSAVSLSYVIGLVELFCPQHLSWVADRLERRLINASIAQTPDARGVVLPIAERWHRDAEAMLEELDVVLSGNPQRDSLRSDELDEWLPDLSSSAPLQAESHEARLAPGWLRAFYRDLNLNATASSNVEEKR